MAEVNVRDRLLAYRADRGWSQAKTAEVSGVSPATIAHIETRANKRPRRITLMRLAQAFGVSLDDFLSNGPPKKPAVEVTPELQLEAMYVATANERSAALEVARDEERERYAATIDRVILDVVRTLPEWEEIAADTARPEHERRVAREATERLYKHIGHLFRLRDEATGEVGAPGALQEMEELVTPDRVA